MKTLKDRFFLYFHGLKAAVAPTLSMPKERFAFVAAVWHYIFRLAHRVDRLITRWQNGTLPAPRGPRRVPARLADPVLPPDGPVDPPAPRAASRFRLPGRPMWLIHQIQGTAFAGSQLRHLLATDAELHAFLRAAPQARRLLNPLLRMLGIDFDKPYGVPLVVPTADPDPACAPAPQAATAVPQGPPPGAAQAAPPQPGPAALHPAEFFSPA